MIVSSRTREKDAIKICTGPPASSIVIHQVGTNSNARVRVERVSYSTQSRNNHVTPSQSAAMRSGSQLYAFIKSFQHSLYVYLAQ